MSEGQFLSLFEGTALQMIEPRNLEKASYVSSSPGAGKTSLFRVFSSRVLNTIVVPEVIDKYKDIVKQLKDLDIIYNGHPVLNSAIISCARGYSIIDEMFQNGKRKHVFFALLNFRITIALIKSIGILLDLNPEEYDRIHFLHIPSEMYSNEHVFDNGKTLYKWACKGERDLCKYLDSERDDTIDISFVHTTLLVLKLFEPSNILIDGKEYFHNTLIIFDDFHKLSDNQKQLITEAIYTLKTNVGVWFGQRLEGISNEQLISMDGSLNRDYNPNIVIDNYWPDKSRTFYKMLERIADKRVYEAQLPGYNTFSDCLDERSISDDKAYSDKLLHFYSNQKQMLLESPETRNRYSRIFDYIDTTSKLNNLDKAIWIQCIIIQEKRRNIGQLSMYLGEKMTLNEFSNFVQEIYSTAKFYVCHKNKLPFYYGYDNLKILSSYNVEQFLYFAGAYFDFCKIKSIERKRKKSLLPAEQEKVLQNATQQKWKDMEFRYANINEIRSFLDSIASLCQKSRDDERAAYAGGSYTGIAIDKAQLDEIKASQYKDLRNKLGACLASKYLERREISNGDIIVFYLNRWLCIYYGLPLAYGGWKKMSLDKLNHIESMDFNLSTAFLQTEMDY